MADPFSSWGSGGSSGGGSSRAFSDWGSTPHYTYSAKGGGGGGSTFLGGLFGGVEHAIGHELGFAAPVGNAVKSFGEGAGGIASNVLQGFWGFGAASYHDLVHPHHTSYNTWGYLAHHPIGFIEHWYNDPQTFGGKIAKPMKEDIGHKFAPVVEHPLTGSSYNAIRADPAGAVFDVLALGSLHPIEGTALHGVELAKLARLQDTAAGRALARAAVRAHENRLPFPVEYRPNEAEGGMFLAKRGRTLQGRLVYNPVREAVGRKFENAPIVGNASRYARSARLEREVRLAPKYAAVRHFEETLSANIRGSKRLSRAEKLALPIAAEYGPQAAREAELGAPRAQRIEFWTHQLADTTMKLQDPNLSRSSRGILKAVHNAQVQRIAALERHGAAIDQALKAPRPIFERALSQARGLADTAGKSLVEAGQVTPEAIAARAGLPQRVFRGEPADVTAHAQLNLLDAHQWVDAAPLTNQDAFYYPHLGPKMPREKLKPSTDSSPRIGAAKAPGEAKRNTGYRLSSGRLGTGPEAWSRASLHVLAYDDARMAVNQARQFAVPYDGIPGSAPLREGYVPFNPDGITLPRAQREAQALDEHFTSLTDQEHANRVRELMASAFPEKGVQTQMQIPEAVARRLKADAMSSSRAVRWLVDKPLAVWKALVLKYRPAWVVNNVVGNHILLLLHNGANWVDYVNALSPENRRMLEREIPGIMNAGTTRLTAGPGRFGGETRMRILEGDFGPKVRRLYTSAKMAEKLVTGVGDIAVKLNQSLADNVPRSAAALKLLNEQRQFLENLDIANGALKSELKGRSLAEVAASMTPAEKAELLRKTNAMLGDMTTLTGRTGRKIRRTIPFAQWFTAIMTITKDLAMDHPEKIAFVNLLEAAAAKDPTVAPQNPLPSWFRGSVLAPWAPGAPIAGTEPLLSATSLNPFQTPVQLTQQAASLFKEGTPSASDNPVASLGPWVSAINLAQGVDPFSGGTYSGPGKTPLSRAALGTLFGLPQTRLLQAAGLAPYYQPAKSYHDQYVTINGHQVPVDAILRYLGYPLRRADIAKGAEYQQKGY